MGKTILKSVTLDNVWSLHKHLGLFRIKSKAPGGSLGVPVWRDHGIVGKFLHLPQKGKEKMVLAPEREVTARLALEAMGSKGDNSHSTLFSSGKGIEQSKYVREEEHKCAVMESITQLSQF